MSASEQDYSPLGTHLFRVERDCMFFVIRGIVTDPDLIEIMAESKRIKQEHGHLFTLYDARQASGIDAAARKTVVAQNSQDIQPQLQVIFGLPFGLRVVLGMLIRAQKLLRNFDVPLHIVDGEAEAQALFAAECVRLREVLDKPSPNS